MRRSSVVLAIAIAACALGYAAARPQAARAVSPRDLRVEQNIQLLKGYIDTQAARHGFQYPARTAVRKDGALTAPIWPLSPFTGLPMAPGPTPGHYTYTVAADRLSYTLAGHLSTGRAYTLRGASPAWLAAERARAAADLKTTHDALTAAQGQVTTLQGQLSAAQTQVTTLQGQLSAAQTQVTTADDEVVKLGTEYIAAVVDRWAVENNDTFPANVATEAALVDSAGQPLYSYWPANPWTGVPMKDSTAQGDYTYSIPGSSSFHIAGHLASGDFGFDDSAATDPIFVGLFNKDDRSAEAGCQALKDYVDEWALANGGALPTVAQLTATGDVGLAHAWWPTNPFLGLGMSPGAGVGQFVYVPNHDGTFTVTVNLMATDQYPATYTAK